ncbi:MAG: LptF/LptG family permease [Caulobacteraceae bacterium]
MSAIAAPIARFASTRLGRIERYVLVHTLAGVVGAAAVLGAVVTLIDFVDLSRSFAGHSDVGFLTELGLTALKSPSVILELMPFVFLFGVLAAFITLNRRSELIAMRAAGISAWRFILPAAATAFAIGLAVLFVLNPLAAGMESAFERGRAAVSPDPAPKSRRIWLRQGDSHTQVIIGAAARAGEGGVQLRDTSLFIYTMDDQGAPAFSRRIEASRARLMKGYWLLTDAREATPGQAAVRYNTLSIPSNLNDRTALERYASPQSISFWTLPRAIRRIEEAGFSATTYRLRLYQLLAAPLLYSAMSVLAAAFSLKLTRLGGLAPLAIAGVASGFGFFFFSQLCEALAKGDVIPPFVAAWIPPILAFLSAFTLLFYTEDG